MILIEVADNVLIEAIREKKPLWLEDAKIRTKAAVQAGKVAEGDGTWGEIKEIFILLQEFKCIYCEYPLPKVVSTSAEKVSVAYDVEHYRPKNRVTSWPTSDVLKRRPSIQNYQASLSSGASAGYVRLAFDPFNYVVSCKVCNSSYKADRFPIAGTPDSKSRKRATLDVREKPLLLFPFGEHGDDPAMYLAFEGPTVRTRPAAGHERLRAQVVIDFFELDTREDLLEGRCLLIQLLWPRLEEQSSSDPQKKARGEAFLGIVLNENRFLHTACGRAFIELYRRDRPRARAWHDAAVAYLTSKDPAVLQILG